MLERNYFVAVSSLLLLLSVIAFSDNLFFDIGQESNRDPKFVVHGIFWLAWFTLFLIQSLLIRRGNPSLHRRVGGATMVVAIGVSLSTLHIFVATYPGWSALPFFAKANRMLMGGFMVLMLLAFVNRDRAEWHKRFVLLANLYVLQPILDRVATHLRLDTFVFSPLAWNALLASMVVYDLVERRRIHGITLSGIGVLYLIWIVAVLV